MTVETPCMSNPNTGAALEELARCRDEIERIDTQLVALLEERLTLGKRIGELKRAVGLPILDPEREALIIRRAATLARTAGLPSEPVREMFWQIVGMSRRVQEGHREGGGGNGPAGGK